MPSNKTRMQGGATWAAALNLTSASGLTAAGASQATALALDRDIDVHLFGTVAASTGAILPAGCVLGDEYKVLNGGANALLIYPHVGGKINAGATDAGVSVAAGKTASLTYMGGVQWLAAVSA